MLTLIIGGARSGKSDLAQRLAEASGRNVLFIATMEPRDDEVRMRIDAHRAARPRAWQTLEEPRAVVAALDANAAPFGFVLIDCITLWVSNVLQDCLPDVDRASAEAGASAVKDIAAQVESLAVWCGRYGGDVVAVSNEVGLGVVPAYPLGRMFRDALGVANRIIAERADRVYYTVAGLAVELKALGAVPLHALEVDSDR